MSFASPEWFLVVPLLCFCGWYWPHLNLLRPLRLLCLTVAILLLVNPRISGTEDGQDLWVLIDRSASAEPAINPRLAEWRTLLERSRGSNDRLHFVEFASDPQLSLTMDAGRFEGNSAKTNLDDAVRFVLARIQADRNSRILLLSDGYSTQPLTGLAERLSLQRVPLDLRLSSDTGGADARIELFSLPARVEANEAFVIDLQARSTVDQRVPFVLYRNDLPLHKGELEFRNGKALQQFSDRLSSSGAARYRVELLPQQDAFAGNNSATGWVEAAGTPRVLVVSGYRSNPTALLLRDVGYDVQVVENPSSLSLGTLSGVRLVVLDNVAASSLPESFLQGLDFFVRTQGGGLLMIGGKRSFGSGGYFSSAVDPLLPVTMELRSEHKRFATAIAFVLDRSGSMSMGVQNGPPGASKLDMANAGAADSVQLLGNRDEVTVLAVDSVAHTIVPLMGVEKSRPHIASTIRATTSGGGGIYVYEGLQAAWNELKTSSLEQKHVILFSDASDSEEPGAYKELLAEMTAARCTVSVIGLGTPEDTDAELLQEIASLGKGQVFFTEDALQLPAIFVQDTSSVARSLFLETPTNLTPAGSWRELGASSLELPSAVPGYNLSYARKEATTLALSSDDYRAPLVAFWQKGSGRTAAIAFPLGDLEAAGIAEWKALPDFIQTLSRYLLGTEQRAGLNVQSDLQGDTLQITLHYSEEREQDVANSAPKLYLQRSDRAETESVDWYRTKPGLFVARIPMNPGVAIRGAIEVGAMVVPFGPTELPLSPEWEFDARRVSELKQVSALSGGTTRIDLSTIWSAVPHGSFKELRNELLVALLLLFLLEALVTRMGINLNWPKLPSSKAEPASAPAQKISTIRPPRSQRPTRRVQASNSAVQAPVQVTPNPTDTPATEPPKDPSDPSSTRAERFKRAKHRRS